MSGIQAMGRINYTSFLGYVSKGLPYEQNNQFLNDRYSEQSTTQIWQNYVSAWKSVSNLIK